MRRVRIAILDTGIDQTRAEIEAQLNKRIKGSKSWIDDQGGDGDNGGHGTHDASLLMKFAPEAHICGTRRQRLQQLAKPRQYFPGPSLSNPKVTCR